MIVYYKKINTKLYSPKYFIGYGLPLRNVSYKVDSTAFLSIENLKRQRMDVQHLLRIL